MRPAALRLKLDSARRPMSNCFVIQPFDEGRFDKRFEDILSPAIIEAGLTPYRVDRDPKVTIPIEEIESGIRSSAVCLADITLDNPNVWFELGFAIAANKSVVLVCAEERTTRFPFDVQHRSIIRYSSESPRDFDSLRKKIVNRLKALLQKGESLSQVSAHSPLAAVEGLSQQELITLAAIAENLDTPNDHVSAYLVRKDVEASGFTKMAAVVGLKSLIEKKLVTFETFPDPMDGDEYTAYLLTESGWQWILRNQEKFQIRKPKNDEEIPF